MANITIMIAAQATPHLTLGVKLRVIRIAAGFDTQEELGNAIGLSRKTISKMEAGDCLDAVAVARWVRCCGQSLDAVL